MGDTPPQEGDVVGQVRETYLLKGLMGLLPFFSTKKTTVPNLVILVVFLVTWGLSGGPWVDRWEMLYPRRGTGWNESERHHLMILRGLFPYN